MIVTVVLMLGALVLLAGFVWTRTATEPAPNPHRSSPRSPSKRAGR